MLDFGRLFPKSSKKKQIENENLILYMFIVEFGIDYEKFREMPIPIILRLLNTHKKIKQEEVKQIKRK